MRDSAPSPDRPGHDDAAAGLLDRRRCLGRLAALALAGGAVPASAARRRPGRDSAAASLPAPVDQLPAVLRQALESSGLPLESFGLHAQPLDGGEALLSWQAARPFVLASTSKLLTSMAALDLLGPAYCWRTRAYLSGPLTQGRLLGDLVIRGGGDAMLTSADLLQWFREIQAQGLRESLPGQPLPQTIAHLPGISGLAAEHGNLAVGSHRAFRNCQTDKTHFFVKVHEFSWK